MLRHGLKSQEGIVCPSPEGVSEDASFSIKGKKVNQGPVLLNSVERHPRAEYGPRLNRSWDKHRGVFSEHLQLSRARRTPAEYSAAMGSPREHPGTLSECGPARKTERGKDWTCSSVVTPLWESGSGPIVAVAVSLPTPSTVYQGLMASWLTGRCEVVLMEE